VVSRARVSQEVRTGAPVRVMIGEVGCQGADTARMVSKRTPSTVRVFPLGIAVAGVEAQAL